MVNERKDMEGEQLVAKDKKIREHERSLLTEENDRSKEIERRIEEEILQGQQELWNSLE